MSGIQDQIDNKREKKSRKITSERKFFRKGTRECSWGWANPELLRNVITVWAERGGALRFGKTSDGGAYAIGVYGDGEPYTVYIEPGEDINDWLQEFIGWASEGIS